MAAMRSLGLPLLLHAYSTQTAGAVDAGPPDPARASEARAHPKRSRPFSTARQLVAAKQRNSGKNRANQFAQR